MTRVCAAPCTLLRTKSVKAELNGTPTDGKNDHRTTISATLPAVGIVIPNYNNERFVGDAIDSALGQDHPDVHVVVVDDGSTDGSRLLLENYADYVTLIFQANSGHVDACRRGVEALATPIVIFLDADDILAPHAASTIARAWRPGVAKIQYQLEVIDEDAAPNGVVFPKYPSALSPETVRCELLRTGAYICPPGLGNAYALPLVQEVPATTVQPFYADALYATIAPLHGAVVTLPVTLGCYRVHGHSSWSMLELDIAKLKMRKEIEFKRTAFLSQICRQRGISFDLEPALSRLLSFQEHRLAIAKFGTVGWRSYLHTLVVFGNTLHAISNSRLSAPHRSLLALWACLVALPPRPLARLILMQRLAPTTRWSWIERLARQLMKW